MTTKICSIAVGLLALMVTGCIKNNIPYPRIQPNFLSFEVEGQLQPSSIDTLARTVTVFLNETVDITDVVVTGYDISPNSAVWADSASFLNGIDLSEPVSTMVSLYQEYDWTISAVQTIDRYFTVEQQVGASTIDVPGRRIVAYVSAKAPISHLKVTSIKLAGSTAVMSPDLTDATVDFSSPVEISVTEFGRTYVWTIYVIPTESSVNTDAVDAWSCVAWLYGSAEAGKENGFEYRRADSDAWIRLTDSQVTVNGGSFTGRLTGLVPETSYVARAYSGEEYGEEVMFTTQATAQMPNSSFDNWWLNGKVWNPWAEGGESYWDTGNKGATTLGSSNTFPTDDTPSGSGRAAQLETRFVGIGMIGKLAAGNIFAGTYVRTDGTNGVLSFGRPFTLHPTKLKGYFKYKTAPISSVTTGFEDLKNRPDTAIIWVALIDAPEPFEIRTNPNNRHLFDPEASDVIAYGKMECGSDVNDWSKFEFELKYKSTSRVPRYILCTASASKYGDYFTGGNGAVLWIDDLQLDYDY